MTRTLRRRLRFIAFVVVVTAVLVVTWPGGGTRGTAPRSSENRLLMYCAAGVREPVQHIIDEYARTYGVHIDVQYGGSGTLLSNLAVVQRGDLYLAADADHLDQAIRRGLVRESIPLARQHLVLAVPRGNPAGILTLADLVRPGVRVAYANPEVASAGKTIRSILEQAGIWETARAQAAVFKPTVNEVINDVMLGAVDVGVVWDPLVALHPALEAVHVPELSAKPEQLRIGVLTSSAAPTLALRAARYLTARDRGLVTFARCGYQIENGDRWEERPAMTLFSGELNRAAITETLRDFEQREGCVVRVDYHDGEKHLAHLMALPDGDNFPDAYLACDLMFFEPVAERFVPRTLLSKMQLVILVPKGNTHGITGLHDLVHPGMRVGLCLAEHCALGVATQRVLTKLGLMEAIKSNTRLQSPTGALLVTQLDTGALDAVVVLDSDAYPVRERFTALPINLAEAYAVQSFAVAKHTPRAQLAQRLLQALAATPSRQRYTAAGFTVTTP